MSWYDEMIASGRTINEGNARDFSYQQLEELQRSGVDVRPLLDGTSMYRQGSAADYTQDGMNPAEFAAQEDQNIATGQNYLSHVQGLQGPNSRAQYFLNPDGSIRHLEQATPESRYGKLNRFALVAGAGAALSGAAGAGGASSGATGASSGAAGAQGAASMTAPAGQAGGLGGTVTTSGAASSAAAGNAINGASSASSSPTFSSQGGSINGAPQGSGGFFDAAGNWISDNAGTIGAIAGGVGSFLDAQNQPSTLTSESTNTTSRGIDPRYQGVVDNYLSAAGSQSPTNSAIQQGQQAIAGAAKDQSLLNGAMATHGQFMADGGRNAYSGSNPYMEGQIQQGMDDITRQGQQIGQSNDALMARGNAFGGSAWRQMQQQNAEATGKAAANFQNQFRFGDYQMQGQMDEARLGRQQNAYMAAPGLDSARYAAGNQLMQSGQQQFNNQQQVLSNQQQAAALAGQVGGTQTSTSTQTSNNPYQQNPYASLIGGGLAGYQIGSQLRR